MSSYSETGFGYRHKIYKYSSLWYAECGTCVHVFWNKRWSSVLNLLEFHVREH